MAARTGRGPTDIATPIRAVDDGRVSRSETSPESPIGLSLARANSNEI